VVVHTEGLVLLRHELARDLELDVPLVLFGEPVPFAAVLGADEERDQAGAGRNGHLGHGRAALAAGDVLYDQAGFAVRADQVLEDIPFFQRNGSLHIENVEVRTQEQVDALAFVNRLVLKLFVGFLFHVEAVLAMRAVGV